MIIIETIDRDEWELSYCPSAFKVHANKMHRAKHFISKCPSYFQTSRQIKCTAQKYFIYNTTVISKLIDTSKKDIFIRSSPSSAFYIVFSVVMGSCPWSKLRLINSMNNSKTRYYIKTLIDSKYLSSQESDRNTSKQHTNNESTRYIVYTSHRRSSKRNKRSQTSTHECEQRRFSFFYFIQLTKSILEDKKQTNNNKLWNKNDELFLWSTWW